MKRSLLIVVLAAAMVFAFASTAHANWGGWTGNAATWNAGGTTQTVGNPYDTTAGGGTPRHSTSYVLWADVLAYGDAGDFDTPHKGYTDSSTLCAVCHSVHYAPVFTGQVTTSTSAAWAAPSTSTVSSGDFISNLSGNYPSQAQMLLRSNVGTACNYCHIDSSIGVKVVYGGQADIFGYAQNFTSSYAHNYHETGCGDCHSVHGARTYDGPLAASILHQRPRNRDPQREVIAALTSSNVDAPALYSTLASAYAGDAINDAYDGDRHLQQTAFCSSCHYVYSTSSAQAIKERGGSAAFTKHHPMADALTTRSAADGAAKGASNNAATSQWAWVGSNTCRTCHNAGIDGGGYADGTPYGGPYDVSGYTENSFPHYTKDNYRFLNQASAAEYATDEVCLSCHRSGTTAGVGITY